ncbi:MAG TPA: ABC transporter ATP-binding protein [Acetobacteraceae bacterium]|nr:ABC transporter ATP-binding protein [Acetobacteraceae bacterium]
MSVPLLATRGLTAWYGDFQALFGINLDVREGEVIALIGANGAGKSSVLKAVCGLLPVARDSVRFAGTLIGGMDAHRIVRRGIAMVPEGRKLFPSLSVEENLRLGAYAARPGPWSLDRVFSLFPILAERRDAPATSLSGGQQQMAAIGRALMANPRLLLCDEISLGLAPIVIRDVYAALPSIRAEGTSLIVVEQDISQVLRVAQRVYCLRKGRVVLEGSSDGLAREDIRMAYFGM